MLESILCTCQTTLSKLAGFLASRRWGLITTAGIRCYIKYYGIDMSIAQEPDPAAYPSFNLFFTRKLKASVRPVNDNPTTLISPVDGTLLQMDRVNEENIVIKNQSYALNELLNDQRLAKKYRGSFIIQAYLSPKDYHRIHMPLSGTLKSCICVPGHLSSVNPGRKQGLAYITKNRRMIAEFSSNFGDFIIIMIGALNVGDIQTAWGDHFSNSPTLTNTIHTPVDFQKGDFFGQFLLGSAIVVLTQAATTKCYKPPMSSLQWGEALLELEKIQP